MTTCAEPHKSPATAYRNGCRCDRCRDAYREYKRAYDIRSGRVRGAAPGRPLPDDGYIDWVAVERLIDGTLDWTGATLGERKEAGRRVINREGGPVFCADVLHLRHDVIRELRQPAAVAS